MRGIARAVETSLKLIPPNNQKGPQQSPTSGASQAAVRISKTPSHPRGTTSLLGTVHFGDSPRAAPLPGPPSPSAARTTAKPPQAVNSATAAPLTEVAAHHSRHQSTINSASTNMHSQTKKKIGMNSPCLKNPLKTLQTTPRPHPSRRWRRTILDVNQP